MEAFLRKLHPPHDLSSCSAESGLNVNSLHGAGLADDSSSECILGLNLREPAERQVIEEAVGQVFGVEGGDLRRATRGRAKVARARQVAMYLAHVACGMSLTEVGRTFARDRTTVSHACGVIEDGRDDPTFDRVLDLLEQVVHALLQARGQSWRSPRGCVLQ